MKLVFIGLTITSSWGNGHATTYRSLIRELAGLGHEILFMERDAPYYASNRDLLRPQYCRVVLYSSLSDLEKYREHVEEADAVIVGSYVPEGTAIGRWVLKNARGVKAFYDIDTPVTLSKLARGDFEYIDTELIPAYDLYLSFSGGPALHIIEDEYGSPAARDLYCSVDTALYYPQESEIRWDLGYLGTYSDDRQPGLDKLMNQAAILLPKSKFVVAGPQYPDEIKWPQNVARISHLPPSGHRQFYNSQRFTLNVTRADMIRAGYSPSVRLFEAAACGVPIISDEWEGLDTIFEPGSEILISNSAEETVQILAETPEAERKRIGENARRKTLLFHSAVKRAKQLVEMLKDRRMERERLTLHTGS